MLLEPLERRRLFVSAPPTVIGLSAAVNITSGDAPLTASGTLTIEISSIGRNYKIAGAGNVTDSDGSYSYSVIHPRIGEMKLTDSTQGNLLADFTFNTPTTGDIQITRTAGGSQSGTFTLTGPDFAFLQGNVLVIRGTTDGDAIGVTEKSSGDILVTRNNITQDFDEFDDGVLCSITGDTGNDLIDSHTLNLPTYVDAGAGNDNVLTGPANDTITGGAGRNTLNGNDGNDRINGSGAADSIIGGAGNDALYGNGGNDTLDGGGGVDWLFGGLGNDLLLGGGSNDKLHGDAGNDTLVGNAGQDYLEGGAGNDKLFPDGIELSL